MNPVSLDAIKLLLDMQSLETITEQQKKDALKVIDQLLFIIQKDVEQAFQKYSTVKLV